MNETEIRALILRHIGDIAPEIEPDMVGPDDDIREACDLDSMDFLNLVIALHEDTGIDIPEEDYPRLRTLNEGAIYMGGKLNPST
jgi:acyl carrier protein